ncbi:hypothetical protein BJY01DRAFT_94919 [Aspergillus pseudoustus]|uniref:C2H2 type zinc finger domain protein n=1 Tax=Aspergillus pseudoustus TaxID=1810923 RepID=A0ABR4IZH4_9EURO
MAASDVSMSFPRKSPRVKDAGNLHQCPHCDRAYERPDHLARHLDSHRNERTFQCPTCHRGFNRRDVLQRHRLIHTDGKLITKHKGRVIEACEECAIAKVSCDNSRPCKRCQRKNVPCVPRKFRRHSSKSIATPTTEANTPQRQLGNELIEEVDAFSSAEHIETGHDIYQTPLDSDNRNDVVGSAESPVSLVPPFSERISSHYMPNNPTETYEVNEFPAFFEHVMMPSNPFPSDDIPHVQHPRSVFDFMCEPEFTSPNAGLFGSDILMDLDRILEFNPSPAVTNVNSDLSHEDQNTKQRVAAFRKSLWLWIPQKNQNGFSEEAHIPLRDGDMTASISSLHKSRLEALNIRGKLTNQLRDHIFQLILRTAGTRLSVPSFPTAESLDALIKIGISKRTETDAWIHPYTLYLQDSRPELLTALVAAGCVCSGIPSINKTGVLLLEIVRVSLAQLVESDNSVLRDLQYFQASMMWLDIGIFCGYKRKMQIAESHLQPLCTALRRAGAFDRSFYSQSIIIEKLHSVDSLESVWYEWIRQESLKRLAYHLFEHDVEAAAAMNRPPLTSYSEYTLPFPSARELWLAPTATEWRQLWVTKYSHDASSGLSLREVLADPSIVDHLPLTVDGGVVKSSLLHGLMSQAWEFRQQALLIDCSPSATRAVTRLWLQSRQEDLLNSIDTAKQDLSGAPAIATVLSEFAMMYLHINFDSIQRFAGQFGEAEARQEYPRLRDWSLTKEARIAVWHAGQVLCAGRRVPPFQLRGFDSLALYHAVLVLWVFGLLRCGENSREDVVGPASSHTDLLITLDGPETEVTKSFINRGIGQPGLTFEDTARDGRTESIFCPLRSPRLVMDVGRQVFVSNFPGVTDNFPPLVDNLRNLIRDLGDLP